MDPFVTDLLAFAMPVSLVLDGARVMNLRGTDIEARLTSHRLAGRPLFSETTDRASKLAGPWLVSPGLDQPALERSVSAAREIGKGVFWLGESDAEVLFRHLRKLGAARMPDGRIMYFRYYDSDVLAAIVPLANAEQAAHLFGSTKVIGLIGGSGDGASVARPDGLPEPAPGPIAFEEWQIRALDERQRIISRQKIARLLRKELPERVFSLSEAALYQRICLYEKSGRAINLTSEEALLYWSRLNLETNEGGSKNEALKRALLSVPASQTNEIFVSVFPRMLENYFKGKTMPRIGAVD